MAYRIETGRLDKAERTPQGGLRVPAAIGRTGCLTYLKADGSTRVEYRPPEEAFSEVSLASLRGAPVTDLHPQGPVTPATFRDVSRGHVGDDPRADVDGEHIAASLYVLDDTLIKGIEDGSRQEASAGYQTDLEESPGVAPDGTRYDAVQRNIIYNHIALGPRGWGRAGASVALRLDSNGDAQTTNQEKQMEIEKIDGIDYEIGSAAWKQARARHDENVVKDLDALKAEKETLASELETMRGRTDALEAELKAAKDPSVQAALVASRVELERAAVKINPEVKADGLSDRELRAQALGIELTETHTDDYLRGRFEAALEAGSRVDSSLGDLQIALQNSGPKLSIAEAARRKKIERDRTAWKGNN